ncbi:MAG: RNA-binding cell elongation regulator Jag/EloR [Culicoidibacterales bacterium]
MFIFERMSGKTLEFVQAQVQAKGKLVFTEVITEGKKGLFGLGAKDAIIEFLTLEMVEQQLAAYAQSVIEQMGIEIYALEITTQRRNLLIQVDSDKNGLLIGRDGETLQALQYVFQQAVKQHLGKYCKFYVELNVANYREQVIEKLQRQAMIAARKAHKSQEPVELPVMTALERKIIHTTLAQDAFVKTTSAGKEPNRYVVIELREDVEQRPKREQSRKDHPKKEKL